MSSKSKSSSGKVKGVATGVGAWFQLEEDGRAFFYNSKSGQTSWGLPLCDALDEEVKSREHGSSDWECAIDPVSGKKFFQSKRIGRLQWGVPLKFRPILAKLPYFTEGATDGKLMRVDSRPKLGKQASLSDIAAKIGIENVLDDTVATAAFHRFLCAQFCEENLLFWGTAEVFRKGSWRGMKTLGVEGEASAGAGGEEGDEGDEDEAQGMLQRQLVKTRASLRIGLPPVDSKGRSLASEARLIFDKFLRESSSMWVCIAKEDALHILERINDDEVDRDLFVSAQEDILKNMAEDLLPRFLRVALAEDGTKVGSGEFVFESDAVVRAALHRMSGFGRH